MIPDDTLRASVSLLTIRAAGFLPDGFGEEYTPNGSDDHFGAFSALHYSKKEIIYKDTPQQVIRGIFASVDSGSLAYPFTAMADRHGKDINTTSDVQNFATIWYSALVAIIKNDLQVGIIQRNSLNVRGVSGSFTHTIDTTDFNITTVNYDRVAVFWGFPDINGCGGGIDCGSDGEGNNNEPVSLGTCYVSKTPTFGGASPQPACGNGNADLVAYTSYPHNSGYSQTVTLEGYGNIGWSHSEESIQVLGDFIGPSGQCTSLASTNVALGMAPELQAATELSCKNTVVVKKKDNLISGAGILASETRQLYGRYRFPRFLCAVQNSSTPWADYCGQQEVLYTVNSDHPYFSLCCDGL